MKKGPSSHSYDYVCCSSVHTGIVIHSTHPLVSVMVTPECKINFVFLHKENSHKLAKWLQLCLNKCMLLFLHPFIVALAINYGTHKPYTSSMDATLDCCAKACCEYVVHTFNSGSICCCKSLETGISPDGFVSLVLSMYIGLCTQQPITVDVYLLGWITTQPVSWEYEPRRPCSVDSLEVLDKEVVLGRVASIVVLSAHHHNVNAAKVEPIPSATKPQVPITMHCVAQTKLKQSKQVAQCYTHSPWLGRSWSWHGKPIDIRHITFPTGIMALIKCTITNIIIIAIVSMLAMHYSESFESLSWLPGFTM